MSILFVFGINDRSEIKATINDQGRFTNVYDGNCWLQDHLQLKEGIDSWVLLFGKNVMQRKVAFTTKPSLVVNQIAEADTHRGSLERCIELCEDADTRVVNHPRHVLKTTRDNVSELLQGIPGVVMPRTIRFNPRSPEDVFESAANNRFAMPFIVRVAGDHGGKSMTLVSGEDDLPSLHVYPFDGRDFYLTEYVDCRDREGFHHRQRLIVVDGEPLLRGDLYDAHWTVHGKSRAFMMQRETWAEDHLRSSLLEKDVIPRAKPAIDEITRRLKLELYGIDCSLDSNGEMTIFEANANMDMLSNGLPEMDERMDMIKGRIVDMLERHSGERIAASRESPARPRVGVH